MTTVTNAKEVRLGLDFRGKITIDWGDGTIEKIKYIDSTSFFFPYYYRHVYSDTLAHTITLIGRIWFVNCSGNHITNIDISKSKKIRVFYCHANRLKELDISKNPKLIDIGCNENYLTYLDVSKNSKLTGLECSKNQLQHLDVSKNIKLKHLECNYNQLTNLDLSANKLLYGFRCAYNNFSEMALNEMLESLCDVWDENKTLKYTKRKYNRYRHNKPIIDGYLFISGNPGTDNCDKSIAENKGWKFISW
jgi:hypothetical protein